MSTAAQEDFYSVLGVTRTATEAEIKSAYFRNVRRHPPEKDADGFRRIHAAYEVLRHKKTRKNYDDTLRTDPEARSLFDQGRKLLEEGKAAEALPLIKRALVRQPDSPVIRDLMTQVLIALEKYDEAEKQARRVLAMEPENATYSIRVGEILRAVDRDAEALPYFRKAVAHDSTNGQYLTRLAYLLNYLDNTEEAIRVLEEGIQSDGKVDFDDFIFFQCLYTIYTVRDRYRDLEATRKRIRTILPPDPEQRSFVAWFYYSNALLTAQRGDFEVAIKSIEEAGSIDNSLPDLTETMQRLRSSRALRDELRRLGDDEAFELGLRMTCVTVGFRYLLGGDDDMQQLFDKATEMLNNELLTEGCNIAAQIRLLRGRYPNAAKLMDEALIDLTEADEQSVKQFVRLVCPNCGEKSHTDKPTVQNMVESGLGAAAAAAILRERGERGVLQLLNYTCGKCHAGFNGLSEPVVATAGAQPTRSACFVVTATYGDENAYPVRVLRAWRDDTLAAHSWGKALIGIYRNVGPLLARLIVLSPILRQVSRRWCERCARAIDPHGRSSSRVVPSHRRAQ